MTTGCLIQFAITIDSLILNTVRTFIFSALALITQHEKIFNCIGISLKDHPKCNKLTYIIFICRKKIRFPQLQTEKHA